MENKSTWWFYSVDVDLNCYCDNIIGIYDEGKTILTCEECGQEWEVKVEAFPLKKKEPK